MAKELTLAITAKDLGLDTEQVKKVSPSGFSQCVRVLRQGWRQGTVGCKGRSDVSFSNKKPWKQKGTGRARAGSARSPVWRKGGVIFGPQPRVRQLTVSKKMRQAVFGDILLKLLNNKNVLSLNWAPENDTPKTAHAHALLVNAGLQNDKIILFVSRDDRFTHASFANLPNVQMLLFDQPNAFDLAFGDYWVVLNKDLEAFKEMVSAWI